MNPADKVELRDVGLRPSEHLQPALSRIHSLVLDRMTEGVSVSDEAGFIVYTNPAEDAMFGYEPGELSGRDIGVQSAFPEEVNQRTLSHVMSRLQSTGEWTGEWMNRRKNGSSFWTSTRIAAL